MTQYGRANRLDSWPVLPNSALRFHAARGDCAPLLTVIA